MGEGRALRPRLERLMRELAKFGAVGALGFLVNVAIFNLCIHTFQLAPIRSGVISQVVAIATNYLGNRYWTYRHIDKSRVRRETSLFFLFSGIALVLENGILALSHYGLGYTSPLADNIAKNVVGLGIGTVFRFWSYRTWVFRVSGDKGNEGGKSGQDDNEDKDDKGKRGASGKTASGKRGGRGSAVVDGLAAQEESENGRQLLK